jgi:hypothetical protein
MFLPPDSWCSRFKDNNKNWTAHKHTHTHTHTHKLYSVKYCDRTAETRNGTANIMYAVAKTGVEGSGHFVGLRPRILKTILVTLMM